MNTKVSCTFEVQDHLKFSCGSKTRTLMETIHPSTYRIEATNLLIKVPDCVADNMRGRDLLTAADYPTASYKVTKRDVRLVESYDGREDVCLSLSRQHESDQFIADGLRIYKNTNFDYGA